MFDLARAINTARAANDNVRAMRHASVLKSLAAVLGLLEAEADDFLKAGGKDELDAAAIDKLIVERNQAKKDKNFARADQIRDELLAQSVVLEDSRAGTTWRRE